MLCLILGRVCFVTNSKKSFALLRSEFTEGGVRKEYAEKQKI